MSTGTNIGTISGIERKALEDNLANRRKPRMFSSANSTSSPATPYHLDFCKWLQSEEFGNNRRMFLYACGARLLPVLK